MAGYGDAERDQNALSTGKLCKYFFTQLFVTFLLLIVFESSPTDPQFQQVENFISYECFFMITELLFYLLRVGSKPSVASFDPTTTFDLMERPEKLACGIAIALYTAHNLYLIYGNWLFLSLPRTNSAGISWLELDPGTDDSSELANKWLFISLKMLFIFSLLQLAIFTAILISVIVYTYLAWTEPEAQME